MNNSFDTLKIFDTLNPKTPLSARWAQMSKQEQIIEKKKMEIQAKMDAQRRATLAAKLKSVKSTDKVASGGSNPVAKVNIFSNDGSFLDRFKKMSDKKRVVEAVTVSRAPSADSSPGHSADVDKTREDDRKRDTHRSDGRSRPRDSSRSRSRERDRKRDRRDRGDRNDRPNYSRDNRQRRWDSGGRNFRRRSTSPSTPVLEDVLHRKMSRLARPPGTLPPNSLPPGLPLGTVPSVSALSRSVQFAHRMINHLSPETHPPDFSTMPPRPIYGPSEAGPPPIPNFGICQSEILRGPPPLIRDVSYRGPGPMLGLSMPDRNGYGSSPLAKFGSDTIFPEFTTTAPPPISVSGYGRPGLGPFPLHGIPSPSPLEATSIPPPSPMNLRAIPPPSPLCLLRIPEPEELDLRSIPPPPSSLVLSTDGRRYAGRNVGAERADRLGGDRERLSPLDGSTWFHHDDQSPEYKMFKNVPIIDAEKSVKSETYDPELDRSDDEMDDKYKPESCLDSSGERPGSTDLSLSIKKREHSCSDEEESREERPARKRKSRWGRTEITETNLEIPAAGIATLGGVGGIPPLVPEKLQLCKITRRDPGLVQYAVNAYGNANLSDEDWTKCEENYKVNLLYQEMLIKRQEIEKLAAAGRFKYEYDSDEEVDAEGGTWEHRLRLQEMEATQRWAGELTRQATGKHHIGDFLPPDELKRFMDKYSAVKGGKEPDLSDYKEFKLREDNIGFKMLQKLGWSEGQGLGADGSGIVDPVNKASQRDSNRGLGVDRGDSLEEGDDEFDAYRKRMMLAYRFRPNPLNNPRRPYY